MAGKDEDKFFERILGNSAIRDPLTDLYPLREVELTAALACAMSGKAGKSNLRWERCRSLPDRKPIAADFQLALTGERIVLTEHPLYAEVEEDVANWGGMRADAIIATKDFRTVILIESKVDSQFTFGNCWPSGQLARYTKFLDRISRTAEERKVLLLLITPCWNADWYLEHYRKLIKDADPHINSVAFAHITWEALLDVSRCDESPFTACTDRCMSKPNTGNSD